MIFIDLQENPPSIDLIAEGYKLTQKLKKLPPEERKKFIDDNKTYWSKLKDHYYKLSHGKCWYTEAKELASYYHMDHFRPKGDVIHLKNSIKTINNDEAYWWLAFDWNNYRLAGSIPNVTKGEFFPLKPNSQIAKTEDELASEMPALLDPTDETDVAMIAFDEAGKVRPAFVGDSWGECRVKISVRVYDLDNIRLIEARKQVQQHCKQLITRLIAVQRSYAETNSPVFYQEYKNLFKELREMTKPTAELSSVAQCYLRNHPEPFIRKIAV